MVTGRAVSATELGKKYAELVQDDPAVIGIWVREEFGVSEIWVQTEPVDMEHERALFAKVSDLHDVFPYALLHMHLLNPTFSELEPEEMLSFDLPSDAQSVFVRRE